MPSPLPTRTRPSLDRRRLGLELALGLVVLLAMAVALGSLPEGGPPMVLVATLTYLAMAGLLWRGLAARGRGLGPANRITLGRGLLVALLAGSLATPELVEARGTLLAGLALLALALDGVDGRVARRTGSASAFGARFDMELDAFLILVLCLMLLATGRVGPWVLAIGGLRYAFVLAGLAIPWLAAPLPASRRRQAVCVWQVATLLVALPDVLPAPLVAGLAATALAGLTASFAADIAWLHRSPSLPGAGKSSGGC
jgi:phosphatidylglycerophosphate synthase